MEHDRQQEAFYRDLVEGSIQGIFIVQNMRVVFANNAFVKMMGYASVEEIRGLADASALIAPEDRARIMDYSLARRQGTEAPERYEMRALKADGGLSWQEVIARPVQWDGAPALQITVVDITERKQAEEALRRSEESLRNAQRIARIGNFEHDLSSKSLTWSDQIFDIFGVAREDGPPSSEAFMAMVYPDDREQVAQAAGAMMQGAGTCRIDYRITLGDGEARDIHMEAETSVDAQGTPVSMSGTVQDVTALRRTEAALSDSEASLRNAQRIARIGSWDWYIAEGDLHWSDEIYRIFGLEPRAFPATYEAFLGYIHPDDRDRVEKAVGRALAGDEPYSIDHRIQLADGSLKIVHEQGEVIRDSSGQPSRMSGTVQDVTELRQAEAEVRRLNTELEQRVEQRTTELREAQAELIKKDRLATMGQLTATVSHELRNPLGAIRTSAFVLSKSLPDQSEATIKAIDRIDRGIARCDRIIDELLDFTRASEIDREAIAVDGWLRAVLSELSIPGGVKLETNLQLGNLAAMIDSGRMRRAVINIVENACQAIVGQAGWDARTSEGNITVSTGETDGDIEIRITDNGPGIPADIKEKIFEPLFSTKNFGVGLGLPTVRQALKQHGGSITLESEPGVGTLFRLSFPLEAPEEGQTPTFGDYFSTTAVGN